MVADSVEATAVTKAEQRAVPMAVGKAEHSVDCSVATMECQRVVTMAACLAEPWAEQLVAVKVGNWVAQRVDRKVVLMAAQTELSMAVATAESLAGS